MEAIPSCCRQPPDGHEFPDYEETAAVKIVSNIQSPPVKLLKCRSNITGSFTVDRVKSHDARTEETSATSKEEILPSKTQEIAKHFFSQSLNSSTDDTNTNKVTSKFSKSGMSFDGFMNSAKQVIKLPFYNSYFQMSLKRSC